MRVNLALQLFLKWIFWGQFLMIFKTKFRHSAVRKWFLKICKQLQRKRGNMASIIQKFVYIFQASMCRSWFFFFFSFSVLSVTSKIFACFPYFYYYLNLHDTFINGRLAIHHVPSNRYFFYARSIIIPHYRDILEKDSETGFLLNLSITPQRIWHF